ncbi:hypothetical protein TSEDIMI_10043 [Tenacibaculum sediminilitoris]|uniref:Imm52 family immunity protein n=1 Tax=Tenacibaculum sediminilitoris TaxID=1820334 RepID=UPI0038952AF6
MKDNSIQQITITWGFRKQTLKECTEELIIFLERLKEFDNRLNTWYKTSSSKKEALKDKVVIEYDYIKKMFCEKCADDEYPEYSFNLSLWNGNAIELLSYSIFFTIGGSKVGNNMVQFTFPKEGELYECYSIRENWEKLLELFINHWKPNQYYNFKDNLIEL